MITSAPGSTIGEWKTQVSRVIWTPKLLNTPAKLLRCSKAYEAWLERTRKVTSG